MSEFYFRGAVTTRDGKSEIRVEQCMPDGKTCQVAYIDDHNMAFDYRNTTISYASGTMHFHAIYDLPLSLLNRPVEFRDDQKNELGCLHQPIRKIAEGRFRPQYGLEFDHELFQIRCEKVKSDHRFTIYVYEPIPTPSPKGLFYPVLATLTGTFCPEGSWEYRIKLTRAPSMEVLMAIFSLPFTTCTAQ